MPVTLCQPLIDPPLVEQSGMEVLSIFSGFTSEDRASRYMVVLQPCIDDSGTHKGGKIFALSGFVASAPEWIGFADEWKAVLDAHPKIEYFKMREAARLKGQFRKFTPDARNRKLLDLLAVIKRLQIVFRVECVVWLKAYDYCVRGKHDVFFNHPYYFAFHRLSIMVLHFQRQIPTPSRADFIYDEQLIFRPRVLKFYDNFKRLCPRDEWKGYLGDPPIFRDDIKFNPLQAADMAAWLSVSTHEGNKEDESLRNLITEELSGIARVPEIWNELALKDLAEHWQSTK